MKPQKIKIDDKYGIEFKRGENKVWITRHGKIWSTPSHEVVWIAVVAELERLRAELNQSVGPKEHNKLKSKYGELKAENKKQSDEYALLTKDFIAMDKREEMLKQIIKKFQIHEFLKSPEHKRDREKLAKLIKEKNDVKNN